VAELPRLLQIQEPQVVEEAELILRFSLPERLPYPIRILLGLEGPRQPQERITEI
jgi:hypothetical protein